MDRQRLEGKGDNGNSQIPLAPYLFGAILTLWDISILWVSLGRFCGAAGDASLGRSYKHLDVIDTFHMLTLIPELPRRDVQMEAWKHILYQVLHVILLLRNTQKIQD